MSGHSKWHQIKRKKAVSDKKKSQLFGRLSREITAAARAEVDPAHNATLREVIARAKKVNMPQANIDRLLAGSLNSSLANILYEAYGPGGVALLIETTTNNPNRTVAEVRSILKEHQGTLSTPGSVRWKFTPNLSLTATPPTADKKELLELALIEANSLDFASTDQELHILAPPELQEQLEVIMKKFGLDTIETHLVYQPLQSQKISAVTKLTLDNLLLALQEHPDVADIFTDTVE
jgi:YebC/PmpR family DNA-binding regulatory protein